MKQIEILVAPTGEVKIDAKNFNGASCTQATKPFVEALGVQTANKLKPEFYVEQTTHNYEQEHN